MDSELAAEPFSLHFATVASYAQNLGLEVRHEFIGKGTTGNFDGRTIIVDTDQSEEQAFYELLHLIGHTYQWNTDAEPRALGLETKPGKTEAELERIFHYERAASEIGIFVLHQVSLTHLDQWISDWFSADWKWLHPYYTTGEQLAYDSTFVAGQAMLTPLAIGPFDPTTYVMRQAFD